MTDLDRDLFAGAQRRAGYDETGSVLDPPAAAAEGPGRAEPAVRGTVLQPGQTVTPFQRATDRPAQITSGGWRTLLARFGLARAAPTAEELEHAKNERIIRQATWTRAVNVVVMNRKGSSCKTPATIIIAGVLASIRGGYVAAWEASESPGDLADRAEGNPPRGLTELLAGAPLVTSAGNLAGYTAPQTSHAAVIGTVSARDELRPDDVVTIRGLLDAYYHLTITDTANNDQSPTFLKALDTADAVLVPCTLNLQSLRGVQRAIQTLGQRTEPHLRHIAARTVVVVSHDGGPEDRELAATAVESLRSFPVRAVLEVPFDPAVRRDGEISLADLSPESQKAWRAVARHLVEALQEAPEASPIIAQTKEH